MVASIKPAPALLVAVIMPVSFVTIMVLTYEPALASAADLLMEALSLASQFNSEPSV